MPSSSFSDTNTSIIFSSNIEFKNSSYENFGQDNERQVLTSKEGRINLDNQNIYLNGDVEGKFILDGKDYILKAESLSSDLLNKSISSKEKSVFLVEDFEILSSSMLIAQKQNEGTIFVFMNANLDKINSKSRINKGKANKIEFFPARDLILMEGNAEFFEDNMNILSDEIHYDLKEDRLLKSVNAKIINNL